MQYFNTVLSDRAQPHAMYISDGIMFCVFSLRIDNEAIVRVHFLCLHTCSLIKTFGCFTVSCTVSSTQFETVMQTCDTVKGLHNFQEFSQFQVFK